ncbi:uncharacterized protein LOC129583637 [Paramacrobiotus metropolitanus]|uniref:uncharacterized protein LOC129583637 n=1 Tax=Paramacrobiotus metropolitanus TaxID=2943436 RepID=UPI002445D8A8|nr:uncharacterized protein LOC129583637 [Paramacrobiotus metropolitanus]
MGGVAVALQMGIGTGGKSTRRDMRSCSGISQFQFRELIGKKPNHVCGKMYSVFGEIFHFGTHAENLLTAVMDFGYFDCEGCNGDAGRTFVQKKIVIVLFYILDLLSQPAGSLFGVSPLTKVLSESNGKVISTTERPSLPHLPVPTPSLPVFPPESVLGSDIGEAHLLSVAHDDQMPLPMSTVPPPRLTASSIGIILTTGKPSVTKPSLSHTELLEHYGLNPAANVLSIYMANFLSSLNKDQLVSFMQLFFYQQQAAVMGLSDISKLNGFGSAIESARSVPNLKGNMDGFQKTGLAQIFGTMSQQFIAAAPENRQLLLRDFSQQIQNLKLSDDLKLTLRTVLHNQIRSMGMPNNSAREHPAQAN